MRERERVGGRCADAVHSLCDPLQLRSHRRARGSRAGHHPRRRKSAHRAGQREKRGRFIKWCLFIAAHAQTRHARYSMLRCSGGPCLTRTSEKGACFMIVQIKRSANAPQESRERAERGRAGNMNCARRIWIVWLYSVTSHIAAHTPAIAIAIDYRYRYRYRYR